MFNLWNLSSLSLSLSLFPLFIWKSWNIYVKIADFDVENLTWITKGVGNIRDSRTLSLFLSLFGLSPCRTCHRHKRKELNPFHCSYKSGEARNRSGWKRKEESAHVSRDIGCRLLSVIKRETRKELDSDGSLFYTRLANTHRSGLSRRTADWREIRKKSL